MGQALYRSHRPKKLSEIVGQAHITTALTHALANETISHAYLFTGPRGVGKTSIARILAHEINGLPYADGSQHLDIIEIDAASNRRIDEIRDLRDKVHIAPTSAKYKVYIIDEVHMLTKEAFNALLKTLEEPPAHVVFILATTEVHKLPETIISRTQRYAFKPVEQGSVVAHLSYIANEEKITISPEALELIAQHGEGSFRDSISLLDQVRNTASEVSLTDVQTMLGIAPAEHIHHLIAGLQTHDALTVASDLRHLHDQGFEAGHIARQLGCSLREALIAGASQLPADTTLKLLGQLVDVPASADPRVALEIALLDAAFSGVSTAAAPQPQPRTTSPPPSPATDTSAGSPLPKSMPQESHGMPAVQITPTREKPAPPAAPVQTATPHQPAPTAVATAFVTQAPIATATTIALDDVAWAKVLMALKQKHNTLYSIARAAQPRFEPGAIVLELSFAFHQKRLNETPNKQKLCDMVLEVTGHEVQINCIIGEGKPLRTDHLPPLPPADGEIVHNATAEAPTPHNGSAVDTIHDIFGGAEVLES
jgi:DNA polymerase-3 subunit gamma/tau